MDSSSLVKILFVLCGALMHCIRNSVAFHCDFDDPHDLLSSNALVSCHLDFDDFKYAPLVCPHQINDAEYVWHPQPTVGYDARLNTYVVKNGTLVSVAISDVVHSESNNPSVRFRLNPSQTQLYFDLPRHELLAITERRMIFICGPRNLVLSDALQRQLDSLNGDVQTQEHSWTSETALIREIRKFGKGLGVVFLYRRRQHIPLQGCGSHPSPLFAADNEVTVDSNTGTRSCVADPMSESRIGFFCEGLIEPKECMKFLLDHDGKIVTAPRPYPYWNFDMHSPWVAARYFDKLALPRFHGECICKDHSTGQVKARIEIRPKNDYVCDIASKIFRNRHRPIRGPWCSVVLHPGSTLTIKFPTQIATSVSTNERSDEDLYVDVDEDVSSLPFSQLPFIYEYETEFLPRNLATLRQLKTVYGIDLYQEVLYHDVLVGDALELDISRISHGEVMLKYRMGKPLALRSGLNSFYFHWTLISRNDYVPDNISAIVKVSLAFTHQYGILGCERGPQRVFDAAISETNCTTKRVGNGVGNTYECVYDMRHGRQVGIHCRLDEELLPNNCESTGYDLTSNKIMQFTGSYRNVTPYPIRGFQVFDMGAQDKPLSFACVCVDQRGYEKSKLIVEYSQKVSYQYKVRGEGASHLLLPYILLPWREIGLPSEGRFPSKSLILNNVSQKSVMLHVGKTLLLHCGIGPISSFQYERLMRGRSAGMIVTTWLPMQPDVFYYAVTQRAYNTELIRKTYEDSIVSTAGGFRVVYENTYSPEYQRLTITSPRYAILISKDPAHKEYVPMTFVCGKAPEQSDLSLVTGDVPSSGDSAERNVLINESSERYTWNVLDVAVKTTDPYMQGCGVTYESDDLFKPETPKLYDTDGRQIGCKIDIQNVKEAAFYCPAPYVLDPPNCFDQVLVEGKVKNLSDISQSIVASHSNHFVILQFDSSRIGRGETLRKTPPLECQCVTIKGVILSTIQIKHYYSKG
ncbi:hypothetical protein BBBOND_0405710 [Babesia bigemina]|uniref:6-Cys domain-containing protein n=1 Tax=Babesia bigemina TaxID=5866 RepID=A0A061DCY9_BABBI|nr:hypothetical protein BBBOND_0405710 [Babesia bigemina]CDR98087.1 hypothetical protein BBBOND_0405710 [Babesia bigemina]|eukprot:XP_012770273.1 hypothetical protein BBBOND_0405710 [Babesia bigemina]